MKHQNRTKGFTLVIVMISATLLAATGARSEVLTSFALAAISPQNPECWKFAWNPNGPVEQTSRYRDLAVVESPTAHGQRVIAFIRAGRRGVLDNEGALRKDAPSVNSNGVVNIPAGPTNGQKRYLIASYTMPRDSVGSVWINDGNLQNKNMPTGTELKILLNGVVRRELTAAMDRIPTIFQQSLGELKKGDTVSVAVGPAKAGKRGGGLLRFTLEEWPDGETLPPPRNTTWQPIEAECPQFNSAGSSATYEAKQASLNETLLARQPELIFVGDSITSRWPQKLLEEHFGVYRPVNLGVSGDWVQNVAWRLRRTSLEAVPLKVAVLMIGTNNLSNEFTPDEIARGIAKLVKIVEGKAPGAKILLLGVLPRGTSIHDPTNDKVHLLNAKIKALADGKKVHYLDVGPSLMEPDGTISPKVMPDGLHPALPGFLRWMEAMKPTLESLLNRP